MLDHVHAHIHVVIIQTIMHLIVNPTGNTDSTVNGKGFDTCGNVDTFAVDILTVVDDISQMNSNTKIKRPGCQSVLHGDSTFHGILNSPEFDKKTITCEFDDPA